MPLGTSGTVFAGAAINCFGCAAEKFAGRSVLGGLAFRAREQKLLGLKIPPIPPLASSVDVIKLFVMHFLDLGGKGKGSLTNKRNPCFMFWEGKAGGFQLFYPDWSPGLPDADEHVM